MGQPFWTADTNPKSEYLNPKQIQNSNYQMFKTNSHEDTKKLATESTEATEELAIRLRLRLRRDRQRTQSPQLLAKQEREQRTPRLL